MIGMNSSVAYADIDLGIAVAVMRNRFGGPDLSAAGAGDGIANTAHPIRPTRQEAN